MKSLVFLLISLISCTEKSTVYFTKTISPEKIVEMFQKLNVNLQGNVGLKVHTGEPNGPYFLRPYFLENIYNHTNGTFLECNVAYTSDRLQTQKHKEVLETNGWNKYRINIMDENPDDDIHFPVDNNNKINITYAGKLLENYDSCLVLSHFKGHQMGGFGGALKQLSIGFASRSGKAWIHTAGQSTNYNDTFSKGTSQEDFTSSMADAASAIVKYFKDKEKGGIAYINVLANISLRCDCAGQSAPIPKIKDIGILASTDPVAIDRACLDLIKNTQEEGTKEFLDQVQAKLGENTINKAEALGIGTTQYDLIDVDGNRANFINSKLSLVLLILLFVL